MDVYAKTTQAGNDEADRQTEKYNSENSSADVLLWHCPLDNLVSLKDTPKWKSNHLELNKTIFKI